MPIIKFQCMSCGLSFSKRVSIETTTQSCTNCKAICGSATQGGVSIGYNNVQVDSVKPQSTRHTLEFNNRHLKKSPCSIKK